MTRPTAMPHRWIGRSTRFKCPPGWALGRHRSRVGLGRSAGSGGWFISKPRWPCTTDAGVCAMGTVQGLDKADRRGLSWAARLFAMGGNRRRRGGRAASLHRRVLGGCCRLGWSSRSSSLRAARRRAAAVSPPPPARRALLSLIAVPGPVTTTAAVTRRGCPTS